LSLNIVDIDATKIHVKMRRPSSVLWLLFWNCWYVVL